MGKAISVPKACATLLTGKPTKEKWKLRNPELSLEGVWPAYLEGAVVALQLAA